MNIPPLFSRTVSLRLYSLISTSSSFSKSDFCSLVRDFCEDDSPDGTGENRRLNTRCRIRKTPKTRVTNGTTRGRPFVQEYSHGRNTVVNRRGSRRPTLHGVCRVRSGSHCRYRGKTRTGDCRSDGSGTTTVGHVRGGTGRNRDTTRTLRVRRRSLGLGFCLTAIVHLRKSRNLRRTLSKDNGP